MAATPPLPSRTPEPEARVRLTVGQAVVRFLAAQFVERDGARTPFFAGAFGIFGHGNLGGIGQALLQHEIDAAETNTRPALPFVFGRNEQAMVHSAVAYARQRDRLQAWAVTTSIGPGSTNMLTGAALATINRIPVLLLPADTFATRVSAPVLQELESPAAGDITVNDAFRPLSRYFDRVTRPEQLPAALLGAMRVLTDPAETGAATIAIGQDVQAESCSWPESFFAQRVWQVRRPPPEAAAIARAAAVIRSARSPLIVAGGGVIYSGAAEDLARFCERTGIPVAVTQAGKGCLRHDDPRSVGAIGVTGTAAANDLAADADVVIGIGTRYSDFTTASHTAFANPDVRFVNINVAPFDAAKQSAVGVVADARAALAALGTALRDYHVDADYRVLVCELVTAWEEQIDAAYRVTDPDARLTQTQLIGLVNSLSADLDVVVCAAGSMPGDLHKLWRIRDPKGYHVEYGYSCMGYEIAGGIGARLAAPDRDVFVLVGDGSYLMMPGELVTAVQESVKVIVVLVQNHGFASIGTLSESLGSGRFGTEYRFRGETGRLDGARLPVDLAANAASLGVDVVRADTATDFTAAVRRAIAAESSTVIHVETDPRPAPPEGGSWWDVPIAETSSVPATREAYEIYLRWKRIQQPYLRPSAD
ncbi:3D-(3,5/4)-trihydroxycyclohexane-1,2-dione acylhydrolase (decyclizing) [Aldersonia sp. NBC_00410]|uniref:3D-(3,5/4)-trihydroxycyclohexane-1,2-dione acylhydrolase (decyclizing) n=1 Tax=Aldersonia sp. NBC_00410 TaxID=2975954 RepID=UPI00225A05F4|nr:3D-(3,5/4)-trihydroxycyclohexane-1,2-dione acylhydrolase (decyclizing) [Aldersonia sp. NBC_00410]MCX5044807.1 3D-(3,5/4)-trihydroxycyclohexane-1,2-dione acylhydrolase (decyclizing) [Aldersonia sp. NBC_00410]